MCTSTYLIDQHSALMYDIAFSQVQCLCCFCFFTRALFVPLMQKSHCNEWGDCVFPCSVNVCLNAALSCMLQKCLSDGRLERVSWVWQFLWPSETEEFELLDAELFFLILNKAISVRTCPVTPLSTTPPSSVAVFDFWQGRTTGRWK